MFSLSEKNQMQLFLIISTLTYILYFGSFVGLLSSNTSQYITTIHKYMEMYVSLFLVYRFNPFKKRNTFSKLDREIAFTAGTFLLMTSTIGIYIKQYLKIT